MARRESIVTRFNKQLRGLIADGTYHRLLHVEWIRADITGDGVPINVARSNRIGMAEPKRVYPLFTAPPNVAETPAKRFYVGGTIYSDWASVPESYKSVSAGDRPIRGVRRQQLQVPVVSRSNPPPPVQFAVRLMW